MTKSHLQKTMSNYPTITDLTTSSVRDALQRLASLRATTRSDAISLRSLHLQYAHWYFTLPAGTPISRSTPTRPHPMPTPVPPRPQPSPAPRCWVPVATDGLVQCWEHLNYAVIGASGPQFSVTSAMPCGCEPAAPGNHVINDSDVQVLEWGSTWWVDGIPPSGPPTSCPRTCPTRRPFTLSLAILEMLRPRMLPDPSNSGSPTEAITEFIIWLWPSLAEIVRASYDDLAMGYDYAPYDLAGGTRSAAGWVQSSPIAAIIEWARGGIVTLSSNVETDYLLREALEVGRRLWASRGSPIISPQRCYSRYPQDPAGHLAQVSPELRLSPADVRGDIGIVACRRHHRVVAIGECGPWGYNDTGCRCALATRMHVVGAGGVVFRWGNTWHTPHGLNDPRIDRWVRLGCSQSGTPWWDGVHRYTGRGYRVYNVERDVISLDHVGGMLSAVQVVIDCPRDASPAVHQWVRLGINQLAVVPPAESWYTCDFPSRARTNVSEQCGENCPGPSTDDLAAIWATES
jgi:hypothetical protein